jgi:hypothetical protein
MASLQVQPKSVRVTPVLNEAECDHVLVKAEMVSVGVQTAHISNDGEDGDSAQTAETGTQTADEDVSIPITVSSPDNPASDDLEVCVWRGR